MREPLANRMNDAEYRGKATGKPIYFNDLPRPLFLRTVRSFREWRAKRDKIWPSCHFRSQELFKQVPANIADFRCAVFEERDLPEGQVAEGEVLETNSLLWMPPFLQGKSELLWTCDQVRTFVRPVCATDKGRWPGW